MSIELLKPGWPAPARVRAVSTTRHGGASRGPWASLNLGEACGDEPAAVRENRRGLRRHLPSEPSWMRQVHGRGVIRLGESSPAPLQADAAWTPDPGRVCVVLHADCLPVLLCDREGRCVAAAHAGWRGLACGVLEATVAAMGVDAGRLMAWLGPCIGSRAYEVGGEVRAAFIDTDPEAAAGFVPQGERWLADLRWLAGRRLARAGVEEVHATTACTHSEPDRFYSYRRDGTTGRMASLIWLE